PGLVMLADQRTAVARGPGREVRPLEYDDPHAPSGEVPCDARPHAAAADDHGIGRSWETGSRHGVLHQVGPYRAFLRGISIPISAYISIRESQSFISHDSRCPRLPD